MMNYDFMNPVCTLIHSGAPNDARFFEEILENLQKRRIIGKWYLWRFVSIKDWDKYSIWKLPIMNQQVKIVLFIFPKEKFNRTRIDNILTYPLTVFNKTKKIMEEKDYTTSYRRNY